MFNHKLFTFVNNKHNPKNKYKNIFTYPYPKRSDWTNDGRIWTHTPSGVIFPAHDFNEVLYHWLACYCDYYKITW